MTSLPSKLRRRLLKVSGAFFLAQAACIGPALAAPVVRPPLLERTTFSAFLDTLLPRDALSGSATDLRVDAKLWAFSELDPRFHRLLELGCRWLNMTGGAGFSDLMPEQQVAIIEWMSRSDWNEVPRRFYELMRQSAIETYYSEPAAWAGLSLQRPPQPFGYPPPWR